MGIHDVHVQSAQGSHVRVPPFPDYPLSLDRFGLCVCWACARKTPSVAWHPDQPMLAAAHTDDWRTLSWYVGDTWADWFCSWCDRQADPKEAVTALITVANLRWQEHLRGVVVTSNNGHAVRDALVAFVEQS